MSSIEKNRKQQRSDPGQRTTSTSIPTSATQTLKKAQENNKNNNTGKEEEEQQETRRTKKRRPTKVGLNDTLRRIRQLMVEGRSNSEIQNILQLEERTFYRYMAKIYEIDQALFEEQENKTLMTEIGILKDRLLKSYRWHIAIADNENIKTNIRMEAQNGALQVALALLKLERGGAKVIGQE